MSKVETLYNSKKIFEELFGTVEIVIETKDYFYNPDYHCFYVEVNSSLDVVAEEVVAYTTSVRGEIPKQVNRFFKAAIPPQIVKITTEIDLLVEDACDLLFSDEWNQLYPDMLCDAVEENIRSVRVKDEYGQITIYPLKIREVYLSEY